MGQAYYRLESGNENEIKGAIGRMTANDKPILLTSVVTQADGVRLFLVIETIS
jgi:hypothetical protein